MGCVGLVKGRCHEDRPSGSLSLRTMTESQALVPAHQLAAPAKLPQSREQAISRRQLRSSAVGHWPDADVRHLASAAGALAHGPAKSSRDELLVLTLYDAALRVSECLALTPADIAPSGASYRLTVRVSKTGPRKAAISASLAGRLLAHAYSWGVAPEARLFPLTKRRVHQVEMEVIKTS